MDSDNVSMHLKSNVRSLTMDHTWYYGVLSIYIQYKM